MVEKLREKYQKQLKSDPRKEFSSEFVRTTDLERHLVDEYGFEAIRLILEDSNSINYYPLGFLPDDCPWGYLNGLDIKTAIETIFTPVENDTRLLINTLCQRCSHLYAEKIDSAWVLHYFLDMTLYDGRPYYQIYSGGSPNRTPEPNASLIKYDWSIPTDLARLYAVHDGFGPILNSNQITVMAQMMDPICQEQDVYPEDYRFSDLLEFHPDGGGNAQCFYRNDGELTTVDWDHEIWGISGSQSFFSYIDEQLSQLDEE